VTPPPSSSRACVIARARATEGSRPGRSGGGGRARSGGEGESARERQEGAPGAARRARSVAQQGTTAASAAARRCCGVAARQHVGTEGEGDKCRSKGGLSDHPGTSRLWLQAGRVAAARPAAARAACFVAGQRGCPRSAALFLRAMRQPACRRDV
jgi:hypothetical protein